MKEICENIIDIVNNSIVAGATKIEIEIGEEVAGDVLRISIKDNGKGIEPDQLQRISDPFFTSKAKRRIGMGTSLLKFHAELTGGEFSIQSEQGKGTRVDVRLGLTHIDRQPLGDLSGTLNMLLISNPEIHFIYHQYTDKGSFSFDSAEISDALGGLRLNHPEVRVVLNEFIQNNLDTLISDNGQM
ncbi:MAG: ATP-binding protein [Bacteroidales bacterium]|nr:ATP-binding protein [Bacteroidales bacterium]